MSVIRKIQRLYRPSTNPGYRREDINVDSRSILDSDIPKDHIGDYTEREEPYDLTPLESIMEAFDYFKPTYQIQHYQEGKDEIKEEEPESLLKTGNEKELDDTLRLSDDDRPNFVPSAIVSYYNESAMKAKERNALDNDQFGLPRLRAYPLNDAKHVKAAIRMFHHCKDPEDRKVLANNIFKAMKKHNVVTKIGYNNPLYQYAPQDLRESSYPSFMIQAIGKPMEKRTKEDIVKEHLRVNSDFYNNAFYGTEYANAIKELDGLDFLESFYPNLRSMNFGNRILTTIGGLGSINGSTYDPGKNWFKVDLSKDIDHTEYCKKLYDIMADMLYSDTWTTKSLAPDDMGILLDWLPRVSYHYGQLQDVETSNQRYREIQYLWDLFWNYNENPDDRSIRVANIIAYVAQMRSILIQSKAVHINEDQIVGREMLRKYLEKELGQSDDIYLLPDTKEYPIVDPTSVLLAMDKIETVPANRRREYAQNLNRRYKELGCTFSISIDHPYARYASKDVAKQMERVLMEDSSLPIDDRNVTDPDNQRPHVQPWYKRSDVYPGSGWHNILDDKEMGPNNAKTQRPEYMGGEALL